MENQQINSSNEADKVVGDLQKDFKIVGSHRVHSWYAWAIVGIVFGMALGIVYVANRSGQVENSDASTVGKICPFKTNTKIFAEEYDDASISSSDWSLAIKYQEGDKSVEASEAHKRVQQAMLDADRGSIQKCKDSFNRQYKDAVADGSSSCDVGPAQHQCSLDLSLPAQAPNCKLSMFTPVGSPSAGFNSAEQKYVSFAQSDSAYIGVNCVANQAPMPNIKLPNTNGANQFDEPTAPNLKVMVPEERLEINPSFPQMPDLNNQ